MCEPSQSVYGQKKIVMCEPSQNMWPKKLPANQSAIGLTLQGFAGSLQQNSSNQSDNAARYCSRCPLLLPKSWVFGLQALCCKYSICKPCTTYQMLVSAGKCRPLNSQYLVVTLNILSIISISQYQHPFSQYFAAISQIS